MKNLNLKEYLSKKSREINIALKRFLPKDNSTISRSMRYSVLIGGKRLRPIFVIAAAELFGNNVKNIMPAACALEYVHTYSLVHDDLPAMDNDNLRRGKLSNHKKFGEATAIMCGDALLTEAFSLITKSKSKAEYITQAIEILSIYSGFRGMICGQAEDTLETGVWNKKSKSFLDKKLRFIQVKKTADLIVASLKIGAVLSAADKKSIKALEVYGLNIGIAFQIIDDILDMCGNKKLLGKKGSDVDNNKLTAVSLYGKDLARKKALQHIMMAKQAISVFGEKAGAFSLFPDYILNRPY